MTSETGFYYLQTRYYDPAICRFINADTFATTDIDGLLSTNMFSYCENNPVMHSDPNGRFLVSAILGGAILGGIMNTAITYAMSKGSASRGELYGAFVSGAIGGSLTFTGASTALVFAVNAIAGSVGTAVSIQVDNKKITKEDSCKIITNGVIGGFTGLVSGSGVLKNKNVVETAADYNKYLYNVRNMEEAELFADACAKHSEALSSSMKWGVCRSFVGSIIGNILNRVFTK